MTSRAASRVAIAALLATNTTFVATYDHESLDFQRKSPVGMVHSDGSAPGPARTMVARDREHALLISIWWARDETTEDYIDALSSDVFDLLEANGNQNATWRSMEIDTSFSNMDYPILDGVMYRREQIRVIVW